jgi:hypothetical protein
MLCCPVSYWVLQRPPVRLLGVTSEFHINDPWTSRSADRAPCAYTRSVVRGRGTGMLVITDPSSRGAHKQMS